MTTPKPDPRLLRAAQASCPYFDELDPVSQQEVIHQTRIALLSLLNEEPTEGMKRILPTPAHTAMLKAAIAQLRKEIGGE
jgi:hypothetical protein